MEHNREAVEEKPETGVVAVGAQKGEKPSFRAEIFLALRRLGEQLSPFKQELGRHEAWLSVSY